jgi:hypothetical protein
VAGTVPLTVIDDEIATLLLVLAASSIPENGGSTIGTVTRNTPTTTALVVNLSSSATSAATVPESVTIPAGATSATFTVTAVNDAIADGNQLTNITAASNGFQSASSGVTILEDDVPSLFIEIVATSISESNGTTTATVKRNTPTTIAMIASLASSDSSEAVVPESVTILAGASEASFTITAMADNVVDGPQKVQIAASFFSFVAGLAEITILDADFWTWTNPRNPLDTDDDNTVSPLDVLSLINDLNSNGSRQLTPPLVKPKVFLDPDRDGFISPLDVLVIVNYLNQSSFGGEGEPPIVPFEFGLSDTLKAKETDLYFSDMGDGEFDFEKKRRRLNSRL